MRVKVLERVGGGGGGGSQCKSDQGAKCNFGTAKEFQFKNSHI